ncbi:MAG: hypothetical protein ACHQHM_05890, partial [Thermoanaerobaculales bacterium]
CAPVVAEADKQSRVNRSGPQLLVDLLHYCGRLEEQQERVTLLDTVATTEPVEPNLAACNVESNEAWTNEEG